MQSPHCRVAFRDQFARTLIYDKRGEFFKDQQHALSVKAQNCPGCRKAIVFLDWGELGPSAPGSISWKHTSSSQMVYPKGPARAPAQPEVPKQLADDYTKACLVLADSPKASAALSRRCLQTLLREYAKVKPSELANEIQELLDSKTLPSYIADAIDSVRSIGNFAAHPMKSKQTGQIADVEPGEAEWLLEVLVSLFDFYFVQPTVLEKKRDAFNAKLKE